MNNNIKAIIIGAIVIFIVIEMINPFKEKFNEGWQLDKDKMCLPYVPNGIVSVYENYSHCTEEQIIEKERFAKYYCSNFHCYLVLKTEKQIKAIYKEFILSENDGGQNE